MESEYDLFEKEMLKGIKQSLSSVEGKEHKLEVDDVYVKNRVDPSDIKAIESRRFSGGTFANKVYAKLKVIDKATGKVLRSGELHVANIPVQTPLKTYLIDGTHYQTKNQEVLKRTGYTFVQENDEIVTRFIPEKGKAFTIGLDPEKEQFFMKIDESRFPLYPIMRVLGSSDSKIKSVLGDQLHKVNVMSDDVSSNTLKKLAVKLFGKEFIKKNDPEKVISALRSYFSGDVKLDPDASKITLGAKFNTVTGDALLASADKIVNIYRGRAEPDNRDDIYYKVFRSLPEYGKDMLNKASPSIERKLARRIEKDDVLGGDLSAALNTNIYTDAIKSIFTLSKLHGAAESTNLLDLFSNESRVTSMGEGGISSERRVTVQSRDVRPTQLNFIDPVKTPAGSAGVTQHLAINTEVRNGKIIAEFLNKQGRRIKLSPEQLVNKVIAFPGEVVVKGKKFVSTEGDVKAVRNNEIVVVSAKEVDYAVPSSEEMYSEVTNMVPFLSANSGGRAIFGTAQMTQAVPLKHREAPLVRANNIEESKAFALGSHSPTDGTVTKVTGNEVIVRGKSDVHKIRLYKNMPLNQGGFLNSEPLVKPGDKVKKGQLLADNNFTKNGTLAIGTNLLTAIMPYKGYNFEDGVVISEGASEKLTSEHIHDLSRDLTQDEDISFNRFMNYGKKFKVTSENYNKIDHETGLVQEGERVTKGDILAFIVRKREVRPEDRMLKRLTKSMVAPFVADPIIWESDSPGTVTHVSRSGNRIALFVKTEEKMRIGDKISNRAGHKGIVTKIVPDDEMIKTENGETVDVIIDPASIPSRVNPGQILEMAAAKIAKKTGKPYIAPLHSKENFSDMLTEQMEEAGVKDKETVIDPKTGQQIPNINVAPEYMMKLKHQVEHKFRARSHEHGYDVEMMPTSGGSPLDRLTFYAMVGHGAKKNLSEMSNLKAQANPKFWAEFEAGNPVRLPTEPTETWKKTEAYLKGMGINIKKAGNNLLLMPLTDKETLAMAGGKITKSDLVRKKDLRPVEGGLFDPGIHGGVGVEATKWSYIELPERMLNPIFRKAASHITGINEKELDAISKGQKEIDGKTGGEAIEAILSKINPKEELEKQIALAKDASKLDPDRLDRINRKIRFLNGLVKFNMNPVDAYMMKYLPVIPPATRQIISLPTGTKAVPSVNLLYKDVVSLATETWPDIVREERRNDVRKDLYEAVSAVVGMGESSVNPDAIGIMKIISGKPSETQKAKGIERQAKEGYFQQRVTSKRQEMSGSSVITVEPNLDVDEIGVPEEMAWTMYKPMIMRRLVKRYGQTPATAKEHIDKRDIVARKALVDEMGERPVLANRAPSWHKFNIMAAKPKLVPGREIQVPNLPINTYFGGDFDGDTFYLHVPITDEAKEEAKRMFPSQLFYASGTGELMLYPQGSGVVGLYRLSATNEGRARINKILPEKYHINKQVTGGDIRSILEKIAKDTPGNLAKIANELSRLGDDYATTSGVSLGVSDFKVRDPKVAKIIDDLNKQLKYVDKVTPKSLKKDRREQKDELLYKAVDKVDKQLLSTLRANRESALAEMLNAGARGNITQIRQAIGAPTLFKRSGGRNVQVPVKTPFIDGLTPAEYFIQQTGGRFGLISKTESVREPGDIGKDMLSLVHTNSVTGIDCGTSAGIEIPVGRRDAIDRYLAEDIPGIAKKNTLVTEDLIARLSEKKIKKIKVRSPLTCKQKDGVCAKCYGLTENNRDPEIGEPVGVNDAQGIINKISNLALKAWHLSGGKEVGEMPFERYRDLVLMPESMPNKATLSKETGRITKIERNAIGGWDVVVNDVRHRMTKDAGINPRLKEVGTFVAKGDILSDPEKKTSIKVQELLKLKGLANTQDYMVEQMADIFKSDRKGGIKRKAIEGLVSSITGLARVIEPGDSKTLPFDYANARRLEYFNDHLEVEVAPKDAIGFKLGKNYGAYKKGEVVDRQMAKDIKRAGNAKILIRKDPVKYEHTLKPAPYLPLYTADWISKLNHKKLKETLLAAAAAGEEAPIHGLSPIPAFAYGTGIGTEKPEEW